MAFMPKYIPIYFISLKGNSVDSGLIVYSTSEPPQGR